MSSAGPSVRCGMRPWDLPWNDSHETLAHDAGAGLTDHAGRPGDRIRRCWGKSCRRPGRCPCESSTAMQSRLDLEVNMYHVPNYHVPQFGTIYYEMDRQLGVPGEQLLIASAAATFVCCWSPWRLRRGAIRGECWPSTHGMHSRSCQGLLLENMGKNVAAGVVPRCKDLQRQRGLQTQETGQRRAEVSHNPAPPPTSTPTSPPSTPRFCPSVTIQTSL